MYYVFFTLHLLIALCLMVVVLLQRSKGNGLAGAFGGVGAGEAMFGAQGVTTFLHKATIYLAIGFMVTSLAMAYLTAARTGGSGGTSVIERAAESVPITSSSPAVPIESGDAVVPTDDTTADDVVPASPVEDTEEEGGTDQTGGR